MEIALSVLAYIMFLFSLPVLIELTLFLYSYIFLRQKYGREDQKLTPASIKKIAILIPAHNEELCIERCIASVLASNAGVYQREVVVIADNCQDDTAILARRSGARVIERFNNVERGKGAALHYAFINLQNDDYDAFLIVDADSIVSSDFIGTMGNHFSLGKKAIQCVYLALNVEDSSTIRLMNLSFLSINVFRPQGREFLGCSVGILGNGFGLTKDLLHQVPYIANSITEDLEYHLKLIENGCRVRFVPETRVLADFPVSKEGSATQRARWEGGRFQLQRKYFFRILAQIFSGNVSMIEPFLELVSLPLSYEVIFFLILVFLPYQPFFIYGIGGLLIVMTHIVVAVLMYGTPRDFIALSAIPSYVFWKLINLPKILLASKKDAKWIRTKRD